MTTFNSSDSPAVQEALARAVALETADDQTYFTWGGSAFSIGDLRKFADILFAGPNWKAAWVKRIAAHEYRKAVCASVYFHANVAVKIFEKYPDGTFLIGASGYKAG